MSEIYEKDLTTGKFHCRVCQHRTFNFSNYLWKLFNGGLYNTYFKSTNRLIIDNFPEFQLFMETVQQSLNKILQTEKLKLSNMVQILTAGQKKTQQQYIHSDNILRSGVILLVVFLTMQIQRFS